MNLERRRNSNAANALQILHTSIHSSNEALADLQEYISHLEELLTVELGAEEFARRLESLHSRDNESLFIPEDIPRPRKRSGSASSENGSLPKKSRSNSLASSLSHASSLGRSILDKPKVAQSNVLSPDVSPKTSRKPSVAAIATANDQRAAAQELALRSAQPFQQPYRAPQAVMVRNVQPSSNYHDRASLPLTTKPPQDLAAAQRPETQPLTISTTRDSTQPGRVSQNICTAPMPSVKGGAFVNPFAKPIAHKLPKKPAFSAAQFTLSANKSSHSSTKLSSSADKQTSPRSKSSQSKSPSKPVSKPIVRKLPNQSADSAARFTFSAEKLLSIAHESSSSSTKLSPSASKAASPASRLPSSVNRPSPPSVNRPSPLSTKSSPSTNRPRKPSPSTNRPRKPSPSSNDPPSASKPFSVSSSCLGESTSVGKRPCRAVKKG